MLRTPAISPLPSSRPRPPRMVRSGGTCFCNVLRSDTHAVLVVSWRLSPLCDPPSSLPTPQPLSGPGLSSAVTLLDPGSAGALRGLGQQGWSWQHRSLQPVSHGADFLGPVGMQCLHRRCLWASSRSTWSGLPSGQSASPHGAPVRKGCSHRWLRHLCGASLPLWA